MHVPAWVWAVTLIGIAAVIGLDLLVFGRKSHTMSIRETTRWVLLYVGMAIAFGAGVWLLGGSTNGQAFFAGYVTEYSLSVDNLFVFVIILSRFVVPEEHQPKVLMIGIALSLLLRGVCIAAGAAAINAFDWVFYIFGALLLYTAVKMLVGSDDSDFGESRTVRLMRRVVPTSTEYDGARFVTKVQGRRMLTPMVVVVGTIGVANVIFALDSIPAIFGLTQVTYLVFTANAFALMGLRQLYFLVGGLLERLRYLNYGLAAILAFIGIKLILEALEGSDIRSVLGVHLPHIGIAISLGFIVVALAITTGASLLGDRMKANTP